MAYTHLKAKELYRAGHIDEAWEIAQKDEGWISDTTRSRWESFMERCINDDDELERTSKRIYG